MPLALTQQEALLNAAKEAALMAYAPYSNFQVGAAILLEDGSYREGLQCRKCVLWHHHLCRTSRCDFCCGVRQTKMASDNDCFANRGISMRSMSSISSEFRGDLEVYYGRNDATVNDLKATTLDKLLPDQMSL